jgi:hypothetical protein
MHTLPDHHSSLLIRSCQKISSLGYNGTNKEDQHMVHLKEQIDL